LQKDEIESLCEIEVSKPILAFINNIVTAPIAAAVVSAESEVVKEQKFDEIEKTAAPAPREIPDKKPVERKLRKNKKDNKKNSRKPAAAQTKKNENPKKSVDIPSCRTSCSKEIITISPQEAITLPPQEETTPKSESKPTVEVECTPGDKGDLTKKIVYHLKKQKSLEQIIEMIDVSNFAAIS
jgi:hypothetical protein